MNLDEIMSQAIQVGQSSNTTAAVMSTLEGVADRLGVKDKLNTPIWQALRQKAPNEILPHAVSTLKEMKLFDSLMSKFGGN